MGRALGGALIFALLMSSGSMARAQDGAAFEKKSFNYSEWTKGRFSELVAVRNPGRFLFFGGVGSEDEAATAPGPVKFVGNFAAQCRYAWDKIRRILEKQGGSLNDIVKATTYVTDVRDFPEHGNCRKEVFAGLTQPAGTVLVVNQLALPGMMIEVDVIAATSK